MIRQKLLENCQHPPLVVVRRARREEGHHRRQARLHGARRQDPYRLRGERRSLLRGENHVRVVRQDDDLRGRNRLDRGHDLGRRRIHRLTALDDDRRSIALEEPLVPVTLANGDQAGLERAESRAGKKPFLACGRLLTHVRDLDTGDHARGRAHGEGRTRIVGVDVDLERGTVPDDAYHRRMAEYAKALDAAGSRLVWYVNRTLDVASPSLGRMPKSCADIVSKPPPFGRCSSHRFPATISHSPIHGSAPT